MANDELEIVRLKDEFYRDGFYRVLIAIGMIALSIGLLIAVSLYIILSKPKPIVFSVGDEWRVLAPVPVDKPYLKIADVVQWVSTVIPQSFTFDFVNYTKQLKEITPYFTNEGWKKQLDLLNTYANYNELEKSKLFVSASIGGAPTILNQGLLQGRYGWWVQIPITLSYSTFEKETSQSITLQVLVVRVPTLNNLDGVGIDNLVIPAQAKQAQANE